MSAQHRLRLPAAFATSAALHAAGLALVFWATLPDLAPPSADRAPAELIRVSLMSRPGGGGGGPLAGPPSTPAGPPEPPAARPGLPVVAMAAPKPVPPPPRVSSTPDPAPARIATPGPSAVASLRALSPPPRVAPRPTREAPPADHVAPATPPAPVAAPGPAAGGGRVASLGDGGGGAGRGGGGAGTGDGSGGDGSDGLARPAYGSNPKPPYPLAARRLGVEGVVTLEVVVRPDGTPAEVHVRRSSGSSLLDESALDTVRERWRFVPARRGDVAVESRVTFPIRFRLDAS